MDFPFSVFQILRPWPGHPIGTSDQVCLQLISSFSSNQIQASFQFISCLFPQPPPSCLYQLSPSCMLLKYKSLSILNGSLCLWVMFTLLIFLWITLYNQVLSLSRSYSIVPLTSMLPISWSNCTCQIFEVSYTSMISCLCFLCLECHSPIYFNIYIQVLCEGIS